MDPLLQMVKLLTDAGYHEFVLIGGLAATAHGSSVVTTDSDIVTSLTHKNAVRIITALQPIRPKWRTRPDLPIVRPDNHNLDGLKNMYLRTDLGVFDILGELPGFYGYEELVKHTIRMPVADGLECKVIDLDTLIAVKRYVARDHDLRTARELEVIRDKLRP